LEREPDHRSPAVVPPLLKARSPPPPETEPFCAAVQRRWPEHVQIRPTRWRIRGPQDYLDDLEDPPEDEDYDVISDA
jgi:hypothetical protein